MVISQNYIAKDKPFSAKLTSSKRTDNDDIAKVFARLMLQGKVNTAMIHLTDNNDQGLH